MDLTNPSPYLGWENDERMSFMKRDPADLVMALALIHHLAISNNLPFDRFQTICRLYRIAQFFQKICQIINYRICSKNRFASTEAFIY